MITLHLGLGDGDVVQIEFKAIKELLDYLSEIRKSKFDCVWLCSGESEYGYNEILITESLNTIELAINTPVFFIIPEFSVNYDLHLHEYETYEDAYAVALDMREPNPKCYNQKT